MIPANDKHSAKTVSIERAKVVDRRNGAAAPKSETENQAMFAAEQEAEEQAKNAVLAQTEARFPIDRRAERRRWSQRG